MIQHVATLGRQYLAQIYNKRENLSQIQNHSFYCSFFLYLIQLYNWISGIYVFILQISLNIPFYCL
jgi:type IV secretory pathway TrbL component